MMANYKDIITGTLNNLVGKAKEVAENGTVRNIYEQGSTRAKAYARIAKLGLEVNGDTEELRRVYTEIGKLYYEENRNNPQGFFAPLFQQAEELTERIKTKSDEMEALKAEAAQTAEKDLEVEIGDFEEVVSSTEDDGAGKE